MSSATTTLRPFSAEIGAVRLPNRVVLAPMSGITDAPFRRLVARWAGDGGLRNDRQRGTRWRHAARRCAATEGQGIGIVQLAGCEAQWMAEGARIAEARGAEIIDINMGCRSRR